MAMEDLATLISEAMTAKDMSLRDVEQASERHGHKVSYSTVSKITKGHYKPGERILVALSVTLGLPIQKLREAAGQSEPGTPFKLPSYASRLSPAERSAVEHLVRVMVEAKDERKVTGNDNPAPNRKAGDVFPAHDDELAKRRDLTQSEIDTLDHAAAPEVPGIRPDQDIE